jgi:hypothetical protein
LDKVGFACEEERSQKQLKEIKFESATFLEITRTRKTFNSPKIVINRVRQNHSTARNQKKFNEFDADDADVDLMSPKSFCNLSFEDSKSSPKSTGTEVA